MSEGSFRPKTWKEALPLIIWGILIFAAGFEGIASLVHGEWIPSIASFMLMLGLTAMLLHWRAWLDRLNPNWIAPAAILLLAAIAASPFVQWEEWLHISGLHEPARKIPDIQQQISTERAQRESLERQLADTRRELQGSEQKRAESDQKLRAAMSPNLPGQRPRYDPYGPGPIIQGKLSQKEASNLIDALNEIDEVVTKAQRNLRAPNLYFEQSGPHGTNWPDVLQKSGFDAGIAAVGEFADQLSQLQSDLNVVAGKYPNAYDAIIYRILGQNKLGETISAAKSYSDAMTRLKTLKEPPDRTFIAIFLHERMSAFGDNFSQFWVWNQTFVQQRIPAARKEIEAYLE